MDNPAPSLLGSSITAEEDGRQILCEGCVEPMGNMGEDQGLSDGAPVQGNGQGGVVEANGCIGENEENEVRGKLETIGEALLTRTIELQALLFIWCGSTALQHQILCFLFDSRSGHVEEVSDVRKVSLRELLTLKGKDGIPGLNIVFVPAFWKQLINLYQKLRMPGAQRWRVCIGQMIRAIHG